MILLLGVGQSFIDAYYAKMNQGQDVEFADMGVMLVVAIILLFWLRKCLLWSVASLRGLL